VSPIVPGQVLGDRYRIEAAIGAGGMATVHRARDLRLGRDVAVKVLAAEPGSDPQLEARFEREALALAAVGHPNVVAVFDVEPGDPETGRPAFLVMELVDEGSLADRLRAGPLDPGETVAIVEGIAAGLTALHDAGLVHRDVKPANILLSPGGPKLGDLGIVGRLGPGAATTLTAPGSLVGTLRYLPPEALEGAGMGPTADTYALAVTAFEALTGHSPRPEGSLAALVAGASAPVPSVAEAAPSLGTAFDDAFRAGLHPDPALRPDPATFASAMRDALERLRDAPTIVAPAVLPPPRGAPATSTSPRDRIATRVRGARPSAVPARLLAALGVIAALVLIGALTSLPSAGDPASTAGAPAGAAGATAAPPTEPPATDPATPDTPPLDGHLEEALAAFGEALNQARGGRDGLRGGDARELEEIAAAVREAARSGDGDRALKAAERLVERTDEVTKRGDGGEDDEGGDGGAWRDELRDAAESVLKAVEDS